ncbi:copper resistance-associated p-type atpase [Paraphaeosphaeria minitans]|uniref:Copper resistance-associated p-type atpase n=1 Tax=Paraphaeosphaeria minitans TaxID=565426 RepID=A0A9P6KRS7_9PLEO|nr:copper resistance-associated p-type atpase [Paraphaeosphaeria minitans]
MAVACPRTSPGQPRLQSTQDLVTTTLFITNLHCPSCIDVIQNSLHGLSSAPEFISYSIVSHSVVLRHTTSLTTRDIAATLEAAGFELHSIFQDNKTVFAPVEVCHDRSKEWEMSLEHAVAKWFQKGALEDSRENMHKREKHAEQCEQCKAEAGGVQLSIDGEELSWPSKPQPVVTSQALGFAGKFDGTTSQSLESVSIGSSSANLTCKATIAISGMTCSSCVSSITHTVEELPFVRSVNINLLINSGTVVFEGREKLKEIIESIEGAGFDANAENIEALDTWRATYAIGGMTCSACVGNVSRALESHSWVEKVDVNLVTNSATIVFCGKDNLTQITETIEDAGYDATLDKVEPENPSKSESSERAVGIRIDGMFCHHCPVDIMRAIGDKHGEQHGVEFERHTFSEHSPILNIRYKPDPPNFTIRDIFWSIEDLNPNFKPSIYHPPTIEDRAREMHALERKRVLFRLLLSVVVAIPTFIFGIVFMSLVKETHPIRRYVMQPMWVGNATRLNWALFILATPVYFLSADTFHRRAMREVKAMWRPGSRTPFLHRFIRFGSMNMLMSLGTSIAYFASVVELALAAANKSSGSMNDSYFDAVVFLTMFILIGRFLEAYSKAKTGDAVISLGKLRPEEAILVDSEKGDLKVATDLLEVGDIVRVHHGTSPPFDGTILDSATTFDESSLTGESRSVKKESGDTVYSGTVNKGSPVKIKVITIAGTSMLDQIINAVREGQAHRAPVERVADTITSHFVPFVVFVAISTWLIWLVLGTSGGIPKDWMNEGSGGWSLWSLRFAIAVFVIACPCGIGLAAPTALFVGGGLAAHHGILVKGGGEAFQEASTLDCIVLDKTGTLTQGGDPAVTSHNINEECGEDAAVVFGLVRASEENSNHPIAKALVGFCKTRSTITFDTVTVDEVPGKGLKGTFKLPGRQISIIAGNEAFMADHSVSIPDVQASILYAWKARGDSVALIALVSNHDNAKAPEQPWTFACAFAIADPLRPDAISVISQLKKRGIDVWMLSGDNQTTANAVGLQVGIPASNIIAGVLPEQKAEKIIYLQKTLTKTHKSALSRLSFFSKSTLKRATVAMVGDGINDAPALSTADLSIAIGSGSDIALSSSSFILINSHLASLLTLLDLSRVVFRRVYFNFWWALIYNIIAMPIAAGVLYPITTGTKMMDMHHNGIGMEAGMGMGDSGVKHVRLDPVWASLAMALSSVSVVCSSLLLRSSLPGVGFRAREPQSPSPSAPRTSFALHIIRPVHPIQPAIPRHRLTTAAHTYLRLRSTHILTNPGKQLLLTHMALPPPTRPARHDICTDQGVPVFVVVSSTAGATATAAEGLVSEAVGHFGDFAGYR